MSDEGYTLAEALAALAILGLAIGGLGLVVTLIARQQLTAGGLQAGLSDARAVDRALEDLVADADPETLTGDAAGFSFPCGAAATCGATLKTSGARSQLVLKDRSGASRRLRLRASNVRFAYAGTRGDLSAWPSTSPKDDAPLRTITVRASDTPLAVARLWRGEARDCQFDVISGACRTAAR